MADFDGVVLVEDVEAQSRVHPVPLVVGRQPVGQATLGQATTLCKHPGQVRSGWVGSYTQSCWNNRIQLPYLCGTLEHVCIAIYNQLGIYICGNAVARLVCQVTHISTTF